MHIKSTKEQGFDFVTHHISICKSKSLERCGVDGSADLQKRGRGHHCHETRLGLTNESNVHVQKVSSTG